jgi:hypothetical protein
VDDTRKELYRRHKDVLSIVSLHTGLTGYCCQTKKSFLVNDAAESKQFNREVDAPDPSLMHVLAAPVCYLESQGNGLPRAVVVVSNRARPFVEEDRRVLMLYSALICRAADFVR